MSPKSPIKIFKKFGKMSSKLSLAGLSGTACLIRGFLEAPLSELLILMFLTAFFLTCGWLKAIGSWIWNHPTKTFKVIRKLIDGVFGVLKKYRKHRKAFKNPPQELTDRTETVVVFSQIAIGNSNGYPQVVFKENGMEEGGREEPPNLEFDQDQLYFELEE